MSATRDDGGPAFTGTLRDWFAGQALAGLVAAVQTPTGAAMLVKSAAEKAQTVEAFTARGSWQLADAMLAERAKVEPVTVCDYEDCGEEARADRDRNGMHGCEVHFNPPIDPPAGAAEYDPARLGEMTAVDGTLKPVCGWETTGPLGRFRCRMLKGHEDGEHYGLWTGPEVERGQAPDTPAAVVLDTVAAQPAPASCGAEKTWGTNKGILCDREKGHKGVHSYGGASPRSMQWVGDADVCGHRDPSSPRVCDLPTGHDGEHSDSCLPTGETERHPPAHVPHCLNCGLILDSARDYCLVCGCEAWLFSQRESDIKCTLRAGHDGDHLNGAVSWGGSS